MITTIKEIHNKLKDCIVVTARWNLTISISTTCSSSIDDDDKKLRRVNETGVIRSPSKSDFIERGSWLISKSSVKHPDQLENIFQSYFNVMNK